MGDAGVAALARGCPLEQLSLYWNLRVTDVALQALAVRMPTPRCLSLCRLGPLTRVTRADYAQRAGRRNSSLALSVCGDRRTEQSLSQT